MAEAYLNAIGGDRFRAYSGGSHPNGKVNPFALEFLQKNRISASRARSKAWDEFAKPDAPHMDSVITVFDQAAGEACPVWPGRPTTAHWGVEDPASVEGTDEQRRASFMKALAVLQKRIGLLANLHLESLDKLATEQHLKLIGKEQ